MDIRKPIPSNGGDWMSRFGEIWKTQVEALKAKFGGVIEEVQMPGECPTDVPIIFVQKDSIVKVLDFVKTGPEFGYDFLSDLTASDEESSPRFQVIYNLYSMTRKNRIRFKSRVAEGDEIPTLVTVWPGANWAEREVFDMFGIKFTGHPDLRRILMDERWQGHPLRKDYPLRGYQIFTDPMQARPELLEY